MKKKKNLGCTKQKHQKKQTAEKTYSKERKCTVVELSGCTVFRRRHKKELSFPTQFAVFCKVGGAKSGCKAGRDAIFLSWSFELQTIFAQQVLHDCGGFCVG